MHSQYEIAVIGCGNAAEGIVHGLLRKMILLDDRIIGADPHQERRDSFSARFNIAVTADNRAAIKNSYIILLAVKPQQFREACSQFSDLMTTDQVLVSIMAGVSTRAIEEQFPQIDARVVRAMPNLAMHVGAGMTGLVAGQNATEADLLRAQRIFEAAGRSLVFEDESMLDAVTAVSGTGPAYFYYFCEAIIRAGEKAGLSHQASTLLATQTCLGAAKMMIESSDTPETLRKKVMSPGGTTEAAVNSMTAGNVQDELEKAVLAAWLRSQELGH